MRNLTVMKGVRCGIPHTDCWPMLSRDSDGRLLILGSYLDLFDLLLWVDENPLSQFREMTIIPHEAKEGAKCPTPFQPSEQFAHLFDKNGVVK